MAILQLVFSGALSIISCVGAQERQVCIKNHDLIAQDSDWAQLKPKAKLVRSGMSSDRKPRWSRKRQNERKVSEQQGYRKVSSLVNLPGFFAGDRSAVRQARDSAGGSFPRIRSTRSVGKYNLYDSY